MQASGQDIVSRAHGETDYSLVKSSQKSIYFECPLERKEGILPRKVAKDNAQAHFIALQSFMNDLKNKTVRDKNRIQHLVSNLLVMIYGYITNSENDAIRLTRMGFPSLKGFGPKELTMTKEDWEAAGLKREALPTLTYFDPSQPISTIDHQRH